MNGQVWSVNGGRTLAPDHGRGSVAMGRPITVWAKLSVISWVTGAIFWSRASRQ